MKSDKLVSYKFSKKLIEYDYSIDFMKKHIDEMKKNNADELLWFLEHHSIFTAGTSAKKEDQNIINKNQIRYVGRGGQWTWHGPGQRVIYIMLDLKKRKRDVKEFVNCLEKWLIATLSFFSLDVILRDNYPGVWIKKNNDYFKIASIGIRISHWITWHGISINYEPDLKYFDQIIPCGIQNSFVTSLKEQNVKISIDELDKVLKEKFFMFF